MNFELRALPLPENTEDSFWFLFYKDKLLVYLKDNKVTIPFTNDIKKLNLTIVSKQYLGRLDNHPCFTCEISNDNLNTSNLNLIGLREIYNNIEEDLFWLAGRAFQIMNWNRNSKFCGKCGTKTVHDPSDCSKKCPNCGLSIYPKISPAIIVAITKENKILLAQNNRFKNKFYSVIAGFVEPGETLEECVLREVKEEVGLDVKNIKYFKSQPWPFPDSLMVGFTAEYSSGEIILDENELCDAKWFAVDNLPEIPGSISIARKLIDWFVENN